LAIGLEVAKVAYMADFIRWSTVCLAKWVDCSMLISPILNISVRQPLTVGASRCAAVCVVTELVDVHATLGIGVIASNVPCNGGWGRLGFLLEGNGTGDLRVTAKGCNCKRTNKTLA
jgi:hypothetical protein